MYKCVQIYTHNVIDLGNIWHIFNNSPVNFMFLIQIVLIVE